MAVGAVNPAGAFDDRRSEHPRLAEQLQRDGRANNVHDGIHRADFVKVNLIRRQAVNFSLGFRNALKDGDGFLFHPRGKFAARDESFDFRKIPLLLVPMMVMVVVRMFVPMVMAVIVRVFVVMLLREVDIKLHAGDGGFLSARDVQVVAIEFEFLQLVFEFARVHAEIEQGGDEHVAGDAAENVEVKGFHCGKETSNNQQPTTNIQ
jgi:hypothetical protein